MSHQPYTPIAITAINEDQKSQPLIIPQPPSELFQYRLYQLLELLQPKTDDTNITEKSFYIEKEMVSDINQNSTESFDSDHKDDMKLLFYCIKKSIAMQINDKQTNIHNTIKGKLIIFNIDLHFKDLAIMYLIAMSNVPEKAKRTPWKIITIMRADTIYKHFKIAQHMLPKSSRKTRHFVNGMITSPHQIHVPTSVIGQTDFGKLCNKGSKRKQMEAVDIKESDLKYFCYIAWNDDTFIPAMFIPGKSQCIEWKKRVTIFDDANGNQQSVAVSLRWSNKQWQIRCMDYDGGRVFYQFRLIGDYHNYHFSYDDCKLINTKLNIL